MYNPDQHFLEIAQQIGIDLTQEDLTELNRFHFELKSKREERLANLPIEDHYTTEAGPTVGGLIGGALGLGLSFLIPGVGLLTGALIGASLGYRVGAALKRPNPEQAEEARSPKTKVARNAFGFDAAPGLVNRGDVIPLIFTNKDINPNGGVRTAGSLINSRIDTRNGGQKLYTLYAIGLGELGSLSDNNLLINGQKVSTFPDNDVQNYFRSGTFDQTGFTDFPFFSEALPVSTNANIGLDLRAIGESTIVKRRDILAEAALMRNGYDATALKRVDFRKEKGSYALFVSKEVFRAGNKGFVGGTITKMGAGIEQWIGITNQVDPGSATNYPFAFRITPSGNWEIWESGAFIQSGTAYEDSEYTIEYDPASNPPLVNYRITNNSAGVNTLITRQKTLVYPSRLVVNISGSNSDGVRINRLLFGKNITYVKGRFRPGTTSIISLEDGDVDRFNISDQYLSNRQFFKIADKNYNNNTLIVQGNIQIDDGDEIYAYWKGSFESSRAVNRLDINMTGRLYARNFHGETIRHAICFDLFVGLASTTSYQFVARFYCSNTTEAEIRRAIRIQGIPAQRVKVEIRPVVRCDTSRTIYKLLDTGAFLVWNSPASIVGSTIQVRAQAVVEDFDDLDDINRHLGWDGIFDDPDDDEDLDSDELKYKKRSTCTEQGAPFKVTTINEIVEINSFYPGIALAGITYAASDRFQGTPTPSFLIDKGDVGRRHLQAGIARSPSSGGFTDPSANFLALVGLGFVGATLRNLETKQEATVTAAQATSLSFSPPITFSNGDRYIVYKRESLVYFPDIFVHSLIADNGGLGALIDGDQYIDYQSICNANYFCWGNQFYWDGAISNLIDWSEWAAQETVGSLLFPSKIDGRYALLPEQQANPVMLFNASNTTDYSEEYVDWSQQQVNTMIVSYTDGSDDYETKTVEISIAGSSPRYEESLKLPSVTNRDQAIRAGALVLKSRRLQDRVCSFKTGLQGCYLRPGDLIVVQHTSTEWNFEKSGFITTVYGLGGDSGWIVDISYPIATDEDISDAAYKAAILFRDTGTTSILTRAVIDPYSKTGKVKLYGVPQVPKMGDPIVLGYEIATKRLFKISSIQPDEDGFSQISAVAWYPEMLTLDGLSIV